MGDYDDDLFQREMTGVAPLKEDDRIHPGRRREPTLAQRLRRASASARPNRDPNPLSLPEQVPQADPYDIVGLKKNGVQEGVYRKLRLGTYEPQARLDLLRVRLAEEFDQVLAFHSAPANQGGAGVTLALLRKTGDASQKNREFFYERSRAQR